MNRDMEMKVTTDPDPSIYQDPFILYNGIDKYTKTFKKSRKEIMILIFLSFFNIFLMGISFEVPFAFSFFLLFLMGFLISHYNLPFNRYILIGVNYYIDNIRILIAFLMISIPLHVQLITTVFPSFLNGFLFFMTVFCLGVGFGFFSITFGYYLKCQKFITTNSDSSENIQ